PRDDLPDLPVADDPAELKRDVRRRGSRSLRDRHDPAGGREAGEQCGGTAEHLSTRDAARHGEPSSVLADLPKHLSTPIRNDRAYSCRGCRPDGYAWEAALTSISSLFMIFDDRDDSTSAGRASGYSATPGL